MRDFNSIWCVAEAFDRNPRSIEKEFDDFLNQIDMIELRVQMSGLQGLISHYAILRF